jgi:DNA-binding CsgD family transcriptional regulator
MLYGRDAERAAIGKLLEGARGSESAALVLRGEAGIGKTALLDDTRERADDMHVLSARGVESETDLPFAGLHQLIHPGLHLLDSLPAPQAAALSGALGLSERRGDDRFLISVACLTLLSELAERRPVLCLVDDAQWLDTPSADALLFVARRAQAEGIVMLFTARDGEQTPFEARDLPGLEVRRLDARAAGSVLDRRVEGVLAASVRDALVAQSRGNALALVELPSALTGAQLAGEEALPDALPLTGDVERLFLERVRRLPQPAQRALSVVAADDTGTLATVSRAAEALGISPTELDAAERAGLVSIRGTSIEVRHPLVRSAIRLNLSSAERRAVHLALAEVLEGELDADRRAWHRAAAALGPDAEIAVDLESTAERARLRSGHGAAASALERAADLSTDSDSKARRLAAAASAAWHAGQPARALLLVDRAEGLASNPAISAELAHVGGDIQQRCGSLLDGGTILLRGGAAVGSVDPEKAVDMLFDAASCGMQSGDYSLVVEAGQQAAALPPIADEEGRFLADLLVSVGSLWLGTTTDHVPLMLDVLRRTDAIDKPRLLAGAAMGAGMLGDEATEAALLRRSVALARASGAVDAVTMSLLATAVAGVLAGRFSVVSESTEGLELAREAGLTGVAGFHLAILSWFAAAQGDDDVCRARAAEVALSASTTANAFANSIAEWGLALLDLTRGRPQDTIDRLTALAAAPLGVGHPVIALASVPDLVEACVRADRTDGAKEAYAKFAAFAESGGPTWAIALAARCRGLLAEDPAVAEEAFSEALGFHAETNRLFDRARSELLFGEHLRRQRKRVASREHLRVALEAFDTLGASPWAERTQSELRASGETARKRDPSSIDQLTPQELQIARFVAEGMTNKEVAAQLFLSPRTIDSHLRNLFAKLEITSRMQLARLPLGDPAAARPIPSSV